MRLSKQLAILAALAVAGCTLQASDDGEWIAIFDGKTLDGWEVHSGTAKYHVEDGVLVGTTAEGSPNSFLCTKQAYGDFILEFEVNLDPELNSGVQIRSNFSDEKLEFWFRGEDGKPQKRTLPPDRIYGYQVEIATEQLGSSGGIYDEARRAFMLSDVRSDPAASKAFKDNQWNKYRIECRGDSIKTWINEVPCAKLKDSMTAKGVIGLQVHQIETGTGPFQVRWRNLRLMPL